VRFACCSPALLALAVGCAPPLVGVTHTDARSVGAQIDANALATVEPSAETRAVLRRQGLMRDYERDAVGTLRRLHADAVASDSPDVLWALAELAYLAAERPTAALEQRRSLYLSAATYAYLYVHAADPTPGTVFGGRLRTAGDIYNRALARAFSSPNGTEIVLISGPRDLTVGQLDVTVGPPAFPGIQRVSQLLPADEYSVRGLTNRHRSPGLGLPVIALFGEADTTPIWPARVGERAAIPLTVLLEVHGSAGQLSSGQPVPASLELLGPTANPVVNMGDNGAPLEFDLTAPLAYQLQEESHTGQVTAELRLFFGAADLSFKPGLYLLEPYQRGKMPVVLVHGTEASSPARWAELLNELYADPVLRSRFQFWVFVYTSGGYIPESAAVLRDTLRELHDTLDARSPDPALDRMVLVGHSQGGLLVRLQVTSSDEAAAAAFLRRNPRSSDFTATQRDFLRRTLEFDAQPFVGRAVFLCTPHRGTVDEGRLPRLVARLMRIRRKLTEPLRTPDEEGQALRGIGAHLNLVDWDPDHVPTSLTEMTAANPFLAYLDSLPFSSKVPYHSIIAAAAAGPLETSNDGVVPYSSAHLDGARSELVVRSGHSALRNVDAIAEVRRILLEHCAGLDPTCRR